MLRRSMHLGRIPWKKSYHTRSAETIRNILLACRERNPHGSQSSKESHPTVTGSGLRSLPWVDRMIEVRSVKKKYGRVQALDDFRLQLPRGALFGLVGPNGAGKSTLLKILATLIRPDAGAALIDGKDVRRNSRSVRTIVGYQPDIPGLYQQMSVEQYLEFFAGAFHLRGEQKKDAVRRALEHSGFQH